jgi:hypothetical protein
MASKQMGAELEEKCVESAEASFHPNRVASTKNLLKTRI